MLDLGTGGGEFLLGVADDLPPDTHATEGWPPNLPVARAALEPAGIDVEVYDADRPGLVSYLRLMPWQLPEDFTVDRYAAELLALHRSASPLAFTESRFLLCCRAPSTERH